jgi:hypothetical protein
MLSTATDVNAFLQTTAVDTLATEVVDVFISGRSKGLMELGDASGLWLDIVVVAESDVNV